MLLEVLQDKRDASSFSFFLYLHLLVATYSLSTFTLVGASSALALSPPSLPPETPPSCYARAAVVSRSSYRDVRALRGQSPVGT